MGDEPVNLINSKGDTLLVLAACSAHAVANDRRQSAPATADFVRPPAMPELLDGRR